MKGISLMYFCEDCERGYRVPNSDPDRHLLTLVMPCPNSACDGQIEYSDPKEVKRGETHTARSLYEACMGMGFPHERVCTPEHLKHILNGAVVVDVALEAIGENRSLISSMLVETKDKEEKTLYFAMSTKGATIYKVEEHANV